MKDTKACQSRTSSDNEIAYEVEELVPIVADLAFRYNGIDSSSVSYEKANQFMEAVIYCIREYDKATVNETASTQVLRNISAAEAYEAGRQLVLQRVKDALTLYHGIIADFCAYGNRCLSDTVQKGMPEFFKWYDIRFAPQETILTLDYPILRDISGLCGIDAIYEYLCCIRAEQTFLGRFAPGQVEDILVQYHPGYRELIENLCTPVISHLLDGCDTQQQAVQWLHDLLDRHYETDPDLTEYLKPAVREYIVRK